MIEPSYEPCPMCGKGETAYEDQIEVKKRKNELMSAFISGRESLKKFSSRENDIFDAFYYLGMHDLNDIARNFGISKKSVETYYDRMMNKLYDILQEDYGP